MNKILTLLIILGSILFACDDSVKNVQPTSSIEPLFDLQFTTAERDSMEQGLQRNNTNYKALHKYLLDNSIPSALSFNPIPVGFNWQEKQDEINFGLKKVVSIPENREDLAFYPISDLAVLIKDKRITSIELTEIYLGRIKKYSTQLECAITITEELAREQAAKADEEISAGNYRGPLHGIPYGVKDLLAVKGFKTTWGAEPFKDQVIQETATVVKKLEEAGAVLIGKLTMGALAMGDVWYGGITKNPWNLEQGSSGSSAGSASATIAGLVGFSIGTETLGSIVSPSTRCGASGLRPSYGRVSRTGAMALSWSMDKIGPICRSIQDAAIVFDVIRGKDGKDQSLWNTPFNFDATRNIKDLKVGYFPDFFKGRENDSLSLETIRSLGVNPTAVQLPDDIPVGALRIILVAEAAAAFDSLTRSGQDDLLVRQDINAWPNTFRTSRFIPAVEYINANRVRYILIQKMYQAMKDFDVIITPSFAGSQLLITNLTGNPCAVVPNGFNESGSPTSISFIGNLFDEASVIELAHAYQQATDFDEMRPDLFK